MGKGPGTPSAVAASRTTLECTSLAHSRPNDFESLGERLEVYIFTSPQRDNYALGRPTHRQLWIKSLRQTKRAEESCIELNHLLIWITITAMVQMLVFNLRFIY